MDKIKNYVIGFLVVVLLLTISWLEVSKKEFSNLQGDLKIAQDSTHHYRNKYGQQIAQTKVMEIDNTNLKASLSSLGFKQKDLEEQVGNLKRVLVAYQGRVGLSGEIQTLTKDSLVYVPGKESIVYKDFKFKTKYLDFEGYFKPSTDTLFAKYNYTSPLIISVSKQSNGFFRKSSLYARATFEDPAARIDDQKLILVESKKKFYEKWWFWGIIGLGTGYKLSH
jgi:hypothetical protein